jgi:peptidoglycan/xylan/chitin deacetylase (PgdA/CDA1 family)
MMGARGIAKTLLWRFVRHAGLAALARRRRRQELLVVTYHGVLRETNGAFLNRNCVSVDLFRQQVAYLKRHYKLLDVQQALAAFRGGGLPPSSALVTFDDGFRNNHELALPVLREAGVPAVVFVATGMLDRPGALPWVEEVSAMIVRGEARRLRLATESVSFELALDSAAARRQASNRVRGYMKLAASDERERLLEQLREQSPLAPDSYEEERFAFMSWEQAREMIAGGVAIGSHTVGHYCLASLGDAELRRELATSKERIEQETGRPCTAFAYPDGSPHSFGERDKRQLRELGFHGAFSQLPGYNAPGRDAFELRRFNVPGGAADLSTFVATISGVREMAR